MGNEVGVSNRSRGPVGFKAAHLSIWRRSADRWARVSTGPGEDEWYPFISSIWASVQVRQMQQKAPLSLCGGITLAARCWPQSSTFTGWNALPSDIWGAGQGTMRLVCLRWRSQGKHTAQTSSNTIIGRYQLSNQFDRSDWD